jgi:hypothetical protein
VLSRAAINITKQPGISDVLLGVVILVITTTLLEKFIDYYGIVTLAYRWHFK